MSKVVVSTKEQPKQQCPSKITSTNTKNRNEDDENCLFPVIPILFLTVNVIIALVRACDHKDYGMIVFVLFLYFGFISLFVCLRAFDRLPRNEDSRKKECLKLAVWGLTTSLNLALAIKFAPLIHPIARWVILALAIVTSAGGFYFFFIYKDKEQCSSDLRKTSFVAQMKMVPSKPINRACQTNSSSPLMADKETKPSSAPLDIV